MITYRNKLNFVTIQWLWFLCLTLAALNSSNIWIYYAQATQPQPQQQPQQQQQQPQEQQSKSTLQLQQEVKIDGLQQQKQQDITVHNFSPRIDYNNNEWRPVGRGDPLKNDPTFDYSPPTLDRVKYWADTEKDKEKTEEPSAALIDAKLKNANPGKNEILLLGVTGDRMRGAAPSQQHPPSLMKNAKGETPLLQPKYTSIRRSYYAHQLPTHLMPPPMQPMIPATQQNQLHSPQMQLQQSQPQRQAMHIVNPAHTEYRHNLPGHSYMTSSPMTAHSKHYYISTATQPWMHASSSSSSPSSSGNLYRYSHHHSHPVIDSHHQETVNYVSYHNRPSQSSTSSVLLAVNGGTGHHDFYSPNSIRGHNLSSTSSRKPWIHDLLRKEIIKPVKPTQNPNSYNVETMTPHFESIAKPQDISTTYTPVTFVTPTTPSSTSTTPAVYITSTSHRQTTVTSNPPMYSTTPPALTTHIPRTTTTLGLTRLLIPNTSNLSYRPTVAPLKMTTDSLFSHYNQPEKPLRGPMYLIIEGHSKVKTYGKDELDPHKPKIVPIIPKREPVVRMADPNEKRGTPETFQVKHLHTTTSTIRTPTTKPTIQLKTTSKHTTTAKPKNTTITSTTVKPTQKNLETTTTTTTPTTTVKPRTTKAAPKLSVTTSVTKSKISNLNKSDKSIAADLKTSAKIPSANALDTPDKPIRPASANEHPTAIEGLLSFIDSSLDSMLKKHPINDGTPETESDIEFKDTTTKLKLIPMKAANQQEQIEARVSTKLQPIKADDYEDYENDNYFKMTTENLPLETRQVFDYDQLPESRVDLTDYANFGDFFEQLDDKDDLSAFNLGDEHMNNADELVEPEPSQATLNSFNNRNDLVKRIDTLVSSSTEEEDFDDDLSSMIDEDFEEDLVDLSRSQQRQYEAKNA